MKLKKIFQGKGLEGISHICFILIFSFAYSFMLTIGQMVMEQNVELNSSHIFPFIVRFLICIFINYFIFTIIPRVRIFFCNSRINRFLNKFRDYRFFFPVIWVFIFLSWIPALLIFFPGIFSYDIISQTGSALGEITNNHHPILHTWLLRIFMRFGDYFFSSYEMGLGIFAILQMLALSYAMTRLVCLLKNKKVNMVIVILVAAFSAFWFPNACLSVSIVKDVPYAVFLLLFACHFVDIVSGPSVYFSNKKNLIRFILVSFLLSAFRNNGIHIYVFCFLFLIILKFRQYDMKIKIKIVAFMLIPIIMFAIYTGPIFSALNIKAGEVREALSVPIQQLQRVAINKEAELTEDQAFLMNYYITDLSWRSWSPGRIYDPFIADPAKSCFVSDNYTMNPLAFWEFYFQIGEQFSKEYIVAFLSNTLGFWYPNFYRFSYIECDNYSTEMFMQNLVEPIERKSLWNSKTLINIYRSLCYSDLWREMPIVRLFFSPGFTLWFLLYGIAICWKKGCFLKNIAPIFLPIVGQYGIMLLSPMSSFRYAWPFYLLLPLVFIGANIKNNESLKV
jgi:hypothetical protein